MAVPPSEEVAVRGTADPEVRQTLPVGDVVPAFKSGQGVIGDLIPPQSACLKQVRSPLFHCKGRILVRKGRQFSLQQLIAEPRVLLVDQLISADMGGAELQRLAEGILPRRQRLPRQAVDEVQIDVPDTCILYVADRCLGLPFGVNPADSLQQFVIQRLHTERNPVDAQAPPPFRLPPGKGPRVGLKGDLAVLQNVKCVPDLLKQVFQQALRYEGRRAAADINGVQRLKACPLPVIRDFPAELLNIRFHRRRTVRIGREIAVGALAPAEGNVHVKGQHGDLLCLTHPS